MTTILKILFSLLCFVSVCFSQNYYELGHKQYFEGKDDNLAIELFTKAIENNQEVAKSYMLRGAAKTVIGNFSSALIDLERSITIDSTNYKSYFYYGRIYFFQGFYNMAIQYFDKAISKNAMDPDIYDDRAIAKAKSGSYAAALQDEDIAIKLNPKKGDYFVNRGYIKYEMKKYNESIIDFNMALKMGDFPRAYTNRGNSYAALKMYDKALADLNVAIIKMPDAIDVPYYRGLVLKQQGRIQEACADFKKSGEKGFTPAVFAQKDCPK